MGDDTPESDTPPAPPSVPNPFVPRYREPWLNPAKRTPVIMIGTAAAVVLLALGFLLGLGVAGGGHRHGPRMGPGMYGRGMYGPGYYGRFGPHRSGDRDGAWRHYPDGPRRQYRTPTSVAPAPSSSHS